MSQPLEVWMVFHVIAATEDGAEESLEQHLDALSSERTVTEFTADVDEVEEVDKPHPSLETGYSQVAEVEMTVTGFADLVELVINYGPTSVDVQAPESIEMDLGEVRDAMNAVAQLMHQFLQSGAGGMMVSRPRD